MNSNEKTLNGVHCTVANCTYHCFDNSCAANSIEVHNDGARATSCHETLCSTYKNSESHHDNTSSII